MDIFQLDYLFFPIHLNVHWTLACLDMRRNFCFYFDSLLCLDKKFYSAVIEYLRLEALDKLNLTLETSQWKLFAPKVSFKHTILYKMTLVFFYLGNSSTKKWI